MDKRKEKYFDFVVNDLIVNTKIDPEWNRVKLPFNEIPFFLEFKPSSPFHANFLKATFKPFSKHIIERYGVNSEEIEILWGSYQKRIEILIDNTITKDF
jgi:hypothetical protein